MARGCISSLDRNHIVQSTPHRKNTPHSGGMSLLSTPIIKAQMAAALGPKITDYYKILREYLRGKTSRTEFDDQVKECLGRDNVVLRM